MNIFRLLCARGIWIISKKIWFATQCLCVCVCVCNTFRFSSWVYAIPCAFLLIIIDHLALHTMRKHRFNTHTHSRNWFEAVKCSIWLTRGALSGNSLKKSATSSWLEAVSSLHFTHFNLLILELKRWNRCDKIHSWSHFSLCMYGCCCVCVSNYFPNFTHRMVNTCVSNQLLPQYTIEICHRIFIPLIWHTDIQMSPHTLYACTNITISHDVF